jgi:tetrahydromethanopterin S-methyltransferase subunit G
MRVILPEMPPSVQQTLGPEATGDFSQWLEVVLVEHAVRRDEYREVLSRLDILEHDVADVKTSITDLHRTMDERFDRVNERFDRVNGRFDEMYRHISTMTRWTVGTLALFGTIITILMAIAQFT